MSLNLNFKAVALDYHKILVFTCNLHPVYGAWIKMVSL